MQPKSMQNGYMRGSRVLKLLPQSALSVALLTYAGTMQKHSAFEVHCLSA